MFKPPVALAFLALALAPSNLTAQEDIRPAGRGGRGGRGGAQATREFLGLGPLPDEAAAKKGEPIYNQNCAACHGADARGGQAPNLVRSVVVLHDEKGEELRPVLQKGGAGMPPFPQLSADDIYNLSQYLHMKVELAANRGTYGATYAGVRGQTTGSPERGKQFFEATCAQCHSATGDLARIGAKFPQAASMQSRFLWPTTPGPAKIKVTTADGQTVSGTIRSLTDFDVSITDSAGAYRYWPRAQVKVEVEDRMAAHRALLPKYTDQNIHDLAAYLVTLK